MKKRTRIGWKEWSVLLNPNKCEEETWRIGITYTHEFVVVGLVSPVPLKKRITKMMLVRKSLKKVKEDMWEREKSIC